MASVPQNMEARGVQPIVFIWLCGLNVTETIPGWDGLDFF